ncbi:MAG: SAM-dependent methyltransferase [Kofleriaceae bacterium]|nr:SAM-dependent methyltransferase [Kofleriaceae bacterium]
MTDPRTRARWAEEYSARARAYWTEERTKQLVGDKLPIMRPADAAVLLRALGLLRDDASLPPDRARKYFQINHMVALLLPALRELRARHPRVRLLDAGCGRSYLTLLIAWCARHVWNWELEVIGVDRNPDLIAEARRRAEIAGLDEAVRLEVGTVEAVDARDVHGVVALHACDTATCDALALGVSLGAELLAVAPCCQAELARGWSALAERGTSGPFSTIWGTPHLRRETAADVTDAMRTALLRAAGYDVLAMEFVPSEHTRKNTLIRAIRRGAPSDAARTEYEALRVATGGVGIRLAERLRGQLHDAEVYERSSGRREHEQ